MLLMERGLRGWSDFFQSSYALFSLIGEGILRGWGEYPSIPTWRILFDKGEISLSGWSDLLSPRMPCSP